MRGQEPYIEPTDRRVCTILFADIVQSTALIGGFDDPEEAMGRLGPGVETIMRCCEEFGAQVTFTGDGALAVFGYPRADEDHVFKAVDCACTLTGRMAALDEDRVDVRVGIHTGEVLVGQLRHARSVELTFSGLVVHVARKIEEAARPNVVTVSRQVIELVGDMFAHGPAPDTSLATRSGEVALYEVTGRDTAVSRWDLRARRGLTPFEGRAEELQALRACWERAERGEGSALQIVGTAGVGKSRLLHEFLRVVTAAGHECLEMRCDSLDSGASYVPVARALGERAEAERATGPTALLAEFERVLDEAGDMAGPIRKALAAPPRLQERAAPATATDPAQRRRILVDALTRIILGLAGDRPLLLAFEDIHWADAGTVSVLARLIEVAARHRVFVVFTTREPRAFDGLAPGGLETIALSPLPPVQCRRLIEHLLDDYASDSAITGFVENLGDRTPFFIEEIALQVRRRLGEAHPGGRAAALGALGQIEIPANVQPLIGQRIDALDPEARKVLLVAAACGMEMRRAILTAAVEEGAAAADEAPAAEGAIARLVAEGLLEAHAGRGTLRFRHALIQNVAYRSLPRMRRAALHRDIYAATRALPDADDDRLAQFRAYHADQGQLWIEAVQEHIRCAEVSMGMFAFETAVANYDRAQHCLDAGRAQAEPRRAAELGLTIRRGLRVSVLPSGDMGRILEIAREVEALAEEIGDERARVAAQFDQAIMLTILSDVRRAVDSGRAALARAGDLGEKGLVANAAFALAQAAWFAGDYALAREIVTAHVSLYLEDFRTWNTGTTGTVSVLALATRANACSLTGAFGEAEADVRRCLEIAEATDKAYDRCFALTAQGLLLLAREEFRQSADCLEAALSLAERAGIDVLRCFASAPFARALAGLGRTGQAREVLRFGLELAERMGMPAFEAWLLSARVLVELAGGRPDEAAELAADVAALCARNGYAGFEAMVLADMALASTTAGTARPDEVEAARRACRERGMARLAERLAAG